ncbi:hypothetical protein Fmac_008166 [Flemingia macrophylla]|uniref:Uncharacterized protein n=1 Tax=Flemingia macrophylla TaxID=520843 RepID=A0ABD1MWN1_9FABA
MNPEINSQPIDSTQNPRHSNSIMNPEIPSQATDSTEAPEVSQEDEITILHVGRQSTHCWTVDAIVKMSSLSHPGNQQQSGSGSGKENKDKKVDSLDKYFRPEVKKVPPSGKKNEDKKVDTLADHFKPSSEPKSGTQPKKDEGKKYETPAKHFVPNT